MLESILQWDTELFLALNNAGMDWLDGPMILISKVWIWVPLYAAVLYLLFKKFPVQDALVFTAILIVGVILTDQGSVHFFKEVFKRPRPCQEEELMAQMRYLASGCGLYGFVSSHAANTFGFAILTGSIFKTIYPRLGIILMIWAIAVSYSRIYIGVHYPLDVLVGALYGILVGRLLFKLAQKRIQTNSPD